MGSSVIKTGGIDIWTDLLIACLVVFVVLAPAFLFRVPADSDAVASASPSKRFSNQNYRNDNIVEAKRRRRVEVEQTTERESKPQSRQ
ncbi:hypothetical protein GN958_ATG15350 [Phytophthora infestans]|uniref:Uncharacterized protein n=1 Tax=Phytophthora infestans TaxID=4787 RepID=A0A8S9UB26_PHYIN|nr:hypothetical protein GN958_ATG15350 [Phytophthora infestans]